MKFKLCIDHDMVRIDVQKQDFINNNITHIMTSMHIDVSVLDCK